MTAVRKIVVMNTTHELAIALEAAAIAGRFIREEYETFVPIPNAPVTISTHVDKGSQELILQHLQRHFPDDTLCAEENTVSRSMAPTSNGRSWVVDPIDGTRGFCMKNGEFSVMIGLTLHGKTIVGVVLEPTTDTYTYASVGQGCFTRVGDGPARRCKVSATKLPTECNLVQSRTLPKHAPTAPQRVLQPASVQEMYSAGVKLAVVARGDGDVYVNNYSTFHDWDICAGHILVEEAGGVVTGFHGEPLSYGGPRFAQNLGLVAAGPDLHAAVIERLKTLPRLND